VGGKDALAPPAWVEKATARLEKAYTAAGKPDNFQVHHFDGGHQWSGQTAVPLLAKVLKEQ
jgi:hypothetical protein